MNQKDVRKIHEEMPIRIEYQKKIWRRDCIEKGIAGKGKIKKGR